MKKIKLNAKFWDKAGDVVAILIVIAIVARHAFDIKIDYSEISAGVALLFICEARKWKNLYEEEKQKSDTRETCARVPK